MDALGSWQLPEELVALRNTVERFMVAEDQAAWQADLGHNAKVDSSICKMYATETSFRVLDRCIQIFGGLGVSHELPLERWFREARIRRIGEGPFELYRKVVARELLAGREGRRSVA